MKFSGFLTGFGVRPLCANHPDTPGQLRPVLPGGRCRNYRPKPETPAGDIKRIPLGANQYALVDAADFEWLNKYHWRLVNGYPARREKGKTIFMHREIMQAPRGKVVDHKDGTKDNNYRSNLRLCTDQENAQNRPKRRGSASRFKGVYPQKDSGKWFARAELKGEPLRIGLFADEVEAARAYDQLAVELFGEFAYLNFPGDWSPEKRQAAYAKKEMVTALRAQRAEKTRRREAKRRQDKDQARQRAKGKKGKTHQGKGQKVKGPRSATAQKGKKKTTRGTPRRQ
jgi:hypothetical protein